jgi:predicted ATP-binding protein involved in virulence
MRNVRLSNGRRVNKKVNVSAHGQEKAIESTKILNQITTFFNSVKVSKIDDLSKWYSSLVIIPENFENPDTLMSYIMRKLSAAELANLKMLTNTGKLSHANRSNLVKKINIALKELTKLTSCIDLRLDLSSQLDLSKIQIETNQSEFAVSMSNRSDGERSMIAYLLMLEELNSNSDNGPNIVLFDEIENHLDPKNQEVLSNLIAATATPNLNFIFSTHSPYIFFNKIVRDKLNIYSTKKEINVTKVEKVISGDNFKLNYSSWAEMNFVAYGISSIQYHNELFGQLVMSHGSIPNADQHLFSKDAPIKNYTKSDNNQKPQPVKCNHSGKCIAGHNSPTKYDTTCLTLPAFIRHTTHHPENTLNKEHTRDELKQSIEFLRQHI